jgi:sulfate transport system permease protein
LPGFGLSFGVMISYLGLIVLLPLACLLWKASGLGIGAFWDIVSTPRVLAAIELSFGAALIAALVNAVFGLIIVWVLVRYEFPGRPLLDALIDLPFALPTAVAGIALAALFADTGWIGALLAPLGINIAFTRWGVVVALIFVGLPFVVRTIEPVLRDLEREQEEAALSLGASRVQSYARVVLPSILPALLTGVAMALARGAGEYGSVIFIAGNVPGKSEILPLLIVIKLEQFDYPGAIAIAVVMLAISFVMLLSLNLLQAWSRLRHES